MNFFEKIKTHPRWIRLTHKEFWSFELMYFPVFFYWFYLAFRARSFFFFNAANPSIYSGGMMGESKKDIYDIIPDDLLPVTAVIRENTSFEKVLQSFVDAGLKYPIICKPDRGERGLKVSKINDEQDLKKYHDAADFDYFLQEYIHLPYEAGILYYRMPNEPKGNISSITLKDFLTVEGDGTHSIRDLMKMNFRGIMYLEKIEQTKPEMMDIVLPKGEKKVLEPIGNHARGTTFLNGNHLIDSTLIESFDKITARIKDVYFARYDLKYESWEDLREGKNFKIMELNGVGAEPAHIYDPHYPFFSMYGDLLKHFSIIQKIATINHRRGVPYMTWAEVKEMFRMHKAYRHHLENKA